MQHLGSDRRSKLKIGKVLASMDGYFYCLYFGYYLQWMYITLDIKCTREPCPLKYRSDENIRTTLAVSCSVAEPPRLCKNYKIKWYR